MNPALTALRRDIAASSSASAQRQVDTPHLLMCAPEFFSIDYEINVWMDVNNPCDKELAHTQWIRLKCTLERLGAKIHLIPPAPEPDLVFTANAGLVYGNTFIPSRFKHPERQGEETHWKKWFADAGFEIKEVPDGVFFEGAGDALFAGNTLFAGHGFRTNPTAYDHIGRMLNCNVVPLELKDPRFYHFDTCFCPLSDTQAIYFPGAFTDESVRLINNHLEAFAVPEADAALYACNAVVIGNIVVHQAGCTETQDILRRAGFDTRPVDMGEFRKSGGSCKCLTIKLN